MPHTGAIIRQLPRGLNTDADTISFTCRTLAYQHQHLIYYILIIAFKVHVHVGRIFWLYLLILFLDQKQIFPFTLPRFFNTSQSLHDRVFGWFAVAWADLAI